jgi:hypothetical protein
MGRPAVRCAAWMKGSSAWRSRSMLKLSQRQVAGGLDMGIVAQSEVAAAHVHAARACSRGRVRVEKQSLSS